MRSIICVPFATDLINAALEQICDPCTIVFPSKISAAQARYRFMENWQLQDCTFLSMDELKQDLLLPPAPFVSDDKRMLCLYQALTENDRSHFNINAYFDIVEWGTRFFQFFEELCDECVDTAKLDDPFTAFGINLLAWQDEYLQRVLDIHARYREMLFSLGFTDPIFYQHKATIRIPYSERRLVFVNQYYYSKLEKEILQTLEDAGNEIVIISQSQSGDIDPKSLLTSDIKLDKLTASEIRTQSIEVIECNNEEQMILTFLSRYAPANQPLVGSGVIIDSKFNQKHYRNLFDPAQFETGQVTSMVQSGIYFMLHTLHKHLNALNLTLEQSYIPLRLINSAFANAQFVRYYQPDWGKPERDELLNEIRWLYDQDILYVDKDLALFQALNDKREYIMLPQILSLHFALLDRLSRINGPDSLSDLIDFPEGLIIRRMCSLTELSFSNILDQFYERLANFVSLGRLNIVSSWSGLFAKSGSELAVQVLQLFLESLAGARLHVSTANTMGGKRYDISNLLDLRNLSYDTVVFFHAIEGKYPSNPNSVWLFNEAQRAKLGLKSYPELRIRERYYFFRQIFSSERVLIFTYRNQEKDIEPGSFVTELLHRAKLDQLAGLAVEPELLNPTISGLYKARIAKYSQLMEQKVRPENADCFGLDWSKPEEFFVIPSSPEEDFGAKHILKASYQSVAQLDKNPFVWYINTHSKMRKTNLRPEETISRKLFGALLHGYLAKVLRPLAGQHTGIKDLEQTLDSETVLKEYLNALISETIYLYKLPQNYNHAFLVSIIADCLVESVRLFYREFLQPKLKTTSFELLPEQEFMTDLESEYRLLTSFVLDGVDYKLMIRGIADLRIECPQQNIVVDFKTGSFYDNQLDFYEWFYYLLDDDFDGRYLESHFWMILDQEAKSKTDPKRRDKWREAMQQNLIQCLTMGYPLGKTAKNRLDLREITRADLYRPPSGGEA